MPCAIYISFSNFFKNFMLCAIYNLGHIILIYYLPPPPSMLWKIHSLCLFGFRRFQNLKFCQKSTLMEGGRGQDFQQGGGGMGGSPPTQNPGLSSPKFFCFHAVFRNFRKFFRFRAVFGDFRQFIPPPEISKMKTLGGFFMSFLG